MMCMYYKEILIDTTFEPYFNIQCGKEFSSVDLDMQPDNAGDNISGENDFWSEITGLYWAWKNLGETKYVGLCSYRRFFNFKNGVKPIELIKSNSAQSRINKVDYSRLDEIFETKDVVTPIPYKYPWSIRRVCSKNYNDSDFEILENYIKHSESNYYEDYLFSMYNSNQMIGHNMFIMKWDDFQDYCGWVFGILLPISKQINPQSYPVNQIRVFGYMHELLLAVYIRNKKFKIYESQISWINDVDYDSRFNKPLYRHVSSFIYSGSKVLGRHYPHIIKKK